jgi:hypothetical protein
VCLVGFTFLSTLNYGTALWEKKYRNKNPMKIATNVTANVCKSSDLQVHILKNTFINEELIFKNRITAKRINI